MSRTAATMNPGATNRRFIMLAVALGLVGAVLVYVAFSRGPSTPGGSGIADTPVVVAKTEIPARTRITESMIEVRLLPANTVSDLGFAETSAVVGQVTRFPIAQNEQVLANKIEPLTSTSLATNRSLSYVIPEGKRGISISVDQVSSAGGLVLPGDYVDVLVIYDVEFAARGTQNSYFVHTLLQNVEVLAVSQEIVDIVPQATPTAGGQRVRNSEAAPQPAAKTVTLLLTPEEAQRVYLAEQNGRIRLSVRGYGDASTRPVDYMTEIDLFPPSLPAPFIR